MANLKDMTLHCNQKDYLGAVGAIVRLQFAYEIDLTELSENKRIKYENSDGETVIIDNYEVLTSVDLAGFAQKAFERRLYHIAIDFARESLRLHKNKNEGVRAMSPEHYLLLEKIRKDLIASSNGLVYCDSIPQIIKYIQAFEKSS